METDRIKSILESLLFTAEGPLSVDRLRSAIGSIERRDVTLALREMQETYEVQQRGVRLLEVANGFQLRTPKEHAEYIKNLVPIKSARMSRANLETLAIVAYKQPITKAEIEEIRGVNVDGVVSTLLERRLIRIVARKDVPGKPFLYGTTKDFLETFNLKDLSGLPTLKEMEEMTQALADDPRFAADREEARDGEPEGPPGEAGGAHADPAFDAEGAEDIRTGPDFKELDQAREAGREGAGGPDEDVTGPSMTQVNSGADGGAHTVDPSRTDEKG